MTTFQMTSLGHSGIRLERGGATVVVDPGVFCAPDALDGADAVLVTHEHIDHVVPDRLREAAARNPDLEVWTNPAVAAQFADLGGRVHAVRHGDAFTVGGIDVQVFGEKHAVIHRDIPIVDNVCFLFDERVFHPGDSLTVPDVAVPELLAPIVAPWTKISEVVDYVREVAPERTYPIHGALLIDPATEIYLRTLDNLACEPQGRELHRWTAGDTVTVK